MFCFVLFSPSTVQQLHLRSRMIPVYVPRNRQITINANSHFVHPCLQHLQTTMNPVYSPASTGVPFTNTKGMGYPGKFKPVAATHKKTLS